MNTPRTLVAIGVTSAIALASCGGSSSSSAGGVPAATWAGKFCTVTLKYSDAVKAAETNQVAALQDVTSVSQGKVKLLGLLQSAVNSTVSAISQMQAAGVPNVSNGDQIQAQAVKAFQSAKTVFQHALAQVQSASTANAQAFAALAGNVGTEISTGFTQVQTSFLAIDQLDTSGQLAKAGETVASCKALSAPTTTTGP